MDGDIKIRGRERFFFVVIDGIVLGFLRIGLVYLFEGLRGDLGKTEGVIVFVFLEY